MALGEGTAQRSWTLRATEGLGEALLAAGKSVEAAAAFERAEALVDELLLGVPLGEGRGIDLAGHEQSNRWLVETYLRLHRPLDAVRTARRGRGRVLLGLRQSVHLKELGADDQRRLDEALGDYRRGLDDLEDEPKKDWELSTTALTATLARRRATEQRLRNTLEGAYASIVRGSGTMTPPPLPATGLSLVVAEVREGLVAFAIDAKGITVRRFGDLDASATPETLAEALLVPFASQLVAAQSLHVLLPASLGSVDLHALPFQGHPLGARLAVDYLADVGGAPVEAELPPRALVVGDPSTNLPDARAEARAVAQRLAPLRIDGGGADGPELLLGAAATRASVVRGLERATLFHFAGHASFGGLDGWESQLLLADDGRLTVADIFALRHVPRQVVLLGCETARADVAASSESLSVAQAFVVAGSSFVVAPTRRVPDADAARMARALYDALAAGAPDLAEALRAAQAALQDEVRDGAAFRVLRP